MGHDVKTAEKFYLRAIDADFEKGGWQLAKTQGQAQGKMRREQRRGKRRQ